MADRQLTSAANIRRVFIGAAATAAGASKDSDIIDMQGFDAVTFLGRVATGTGTGTGATLQARSATATDGSFSDISGASAEATAAQQTLLVDVYRPGQRYVRARVTSPGGVTANFGDVYAVRFLARDKAVTNSVSGASGQVLTQTQAG